MLDYYGSIVKTAEEIDKELINNFKDKCYESYLKQIICDLRKENVLRNEYSVSGWYTFSKQNILEIITITMNYKKQQTERQLKFAYCYYKLYHNTDICRLICDTI